MEKTDLTRKYKTYFTAKAQPEIVNIEPAQFISLTGKGDPSDKAYADNVQALYATAYAIKFICKAKQADFVVSKLECLWWFDEKEYGQLSSAEAPVKIPRSEWEYRLLIRMPDYVTSKDIDEGIKATLEKKKAPLAQSIELYTLTEGKSIQVLHKGSFASEPDTLQKMDELAKLNGLLPNGQHHEIYMTDFTKTKPESLKTILRYPVK